MLLLTPKLVNKMMNTKETSSQPSGGKMKKQGEDDKGWGKMWLGTRSHQDEPLIRKYS
jgi:hypothetical protein